ncbi:MAG: hypothetical protein KAQ98_08305 [Bacteriovoracaceae bacterium]|nr:hypothetical protein [Bacteriovoracaceae bacterium]
MKRFTLIGFAGFVLFFSFIFLSFDVFATEVELSSFKITDIDDLREKYSSDSKNVGRHFKRRSNDQNEHDPGDDSPLYREILNHLENYEAIGHEQANNILDNGFNVGGFNTPGFHWHKPYGDYTIAVRRQIDPDLFHDTRFIVTDELLIEIKASKFLSNLDDSGIIDITKKQLAAFAGIKFKRIYRYTHFADSYLDGLTTRFDKLFFGFLKFIGRGYLNIEPDEFLERVDHFSCNAGGLVSVPVYLNGAVNVWAQAGVLAEYERVATSTIHKVSDDDRKSSDSDDVLRISSEKMKSLEVGATAQLKADFFYVLKLTLLSFDYSYELADAYKVYLKFDEDGIESIRTDDNLARAVSRAIRGRGPDGDLLEPYVVSEEQRIKQIVQSRYLLFLLGGKKDKQTEQVKITRDGLITTFFKHYYEDLIYVQSIWQTLLPKVLKNLFNTEAIFQSIVSHKRVVRVEYRNERELMKNREILKLKSDGKEKFSASLETDYFVKRTHTRGSRSFKTKALNLLGMYAEVDPQITSWVNENQLRGPMNINIKANLNLAAIQYLNDLSQSKVRDFIDNLCEIPKRKKRNIFTRVSREIKEKKCQRKVLRSWGKYVFAFTRKNVSAQYSEFCRKKSKKAGWWKRKKSFKKCILKGSVKTVRERRQELPMWELKGFLRSMNKYVKNRSHLVNFFGKENVFTHGKFRATTASGLSFVTNYNEGLFRGFGVVDNFLRDNSMRKIASTSLSVDE